MPWMMSKFACAVLLLPGAHAGKLEFFSSDLNKECALDNIKASWGTSFTLAGQDLKLDAAYDRKAKSDFFKEATLSGAVDCVGYTATHSFATGLSKLTLTTKQFGANVKAVLKGSKVLSTLSATKDITVADIGIKLAPSYDLETSKGKVKASASYVVGSGATIHGELSATDEGTIDSTFDVELTRTLDGRDLSAVVRPLEQEAELQVTDAAIGTLKCSYATGASPKLTLKRAVSF
jgi:hypothetical protein